MGGRKHWVSSFVGFVFLLVLLNQLVEASAISSSCRHIAIGVVTDQSSRMGRQQKIAIEMALQTFHFSASFPKLELFNNDSNGNSARAITSGNSNFFFRMIWTSILDQQAVYRKISIKLTISPLLSYSNSDSINACVFNLIIHFTHIIYFWRCMLYIFRHWILLDYHIIIFI